MHQSQPQLICSQLAPEQAHFLCLCEVRVYTESPRVVIVRTDVRQMLKINVDTRSDDEVLIINNDIRVMPGDQRRGKSQDMKPLDDFSPPITDFCGAEVLRNCFLASNEILIF